MKPADGRRRVVIESVSPQIDEGAHPARRICGNALLVGAAIFADGKDEIAARVLFRHASEKRWRSAPMRAAGDDLWSGTFVMDKLGAWSFTILGWVDHFATWVSDLKKRLAAQNQPELLDHTIAAVAAMSPNPNAAHGSGSNPAMQDIALALRSGAALVDKAAARAQGNDVKRMGEMARQMELLATEQRYIFDEPFHEELQRLMARYPDLAHATRFEPELPVWVERKRAQFSSWYELFPRSASSIPGQHGTLNDVERQLPEIAAMGFDVVYMPPIHPIGQPSGRGQTMRRSLRQMLPEVPGPSVTGQPWHMARLALRLRATAAAINPSIHSLGLLRISIAWSIPHDRGTLRLR